MCDILYHNTEPKFLLLNIYFPSIFNLFSFTWHIFLFRYFVNFVKVFKIFFHVYYLILCIPSHSNFLITCCYRSPAATYRLNLLYVRSSSLENSDPIYWIISSWEERSCLSDVPFGLLCVFGCCLYKKYRSEKSAILNVLLFCKQKI